MRNEHMVQSISLAPAAESVNAKEDGKDAKQRRRRMKENASDPARQWREAFP